MKIQSPPGMRDFYPEDMRLQNWLFEHWRGVSRSFGFSEYEGPIFEFLALYEAKSGPGIVSEVFNFQDRGERHFAIRPEMTPTLARMVAARANTLSRPIKWFSLPRMCRAERPQRGRLREFFQWNVDILGMDDVLADAEVIAVAVAFLKRVGLTPEDVVVKLSSRALATAILTGTGLAEDQVEPAFQLIDRAEKLSPDAFEEQWSAQCGQAISAATVLELLAGTDLDACLSMAGSGSGDTGRGAAEEFRALWDNLALFGVQDFCEFDLRTVRGLAYYTGPVFEVKTRKLGLRALFGGGRYDNLTQVLGGPRVTGVGFGAGDVPMLECLKDLGRLPTLGDELDVFIIDADAELFPKVLEIAGKLRQTGLTVDFSYKRQGLGKQFKQASARNARTAVIVGSELTERGELTIKNLTTGDQRTVAAETFLADPRGELTNQKTVASR
ncbi:MAG: histidine--tRNA ligase [Phycisphaerae bacterium]|nr:histidine--tRNA ligase [Phycisphaerae bacterium]